MRAKGPDMLSHKTVKVHQMEDKLVRLLEYAERTNRAGIPKTRSQLAEAMNLSGTPGTGRLDGSRITKAATGEREFTDAMHAALLSAFGLSWPCPTYFDPENRKRDRSLEAFERTICILEGAIDLMHSPKNWPEFPLEELYVMDVQDVSEKYAYLADIVAKCATFPIVGDSEPMLGIRIGSAGFSQISIRASMPLGVEWHTERPNEWDKSNPRGLEIRDRSTRTFCLWQVRKLPTTEGAPFIDQNMPVFRLGVSSLKFDEEIVIVTTAPLPEIKLAADDSTDLDSGQLARFERLARNQILQAYRGGPGEVDPSREVLTIGRVALKRRDTL